MKLGQIDQTLTELSIDTLSAYKQAAKNPDNFRTRPLRKLAKTASGVSTANSKLAAAPQKPMAYADRLSEITAMDESLQRGEFYVWIATLADGSKEEVKAYDGTTKQDVIDIFAEEGLQVVDVTPNWGIHGGGRRMDPTQQRDYHTQQDKLDKDTRNYTEDKEDPFTSILNKQHTEKPKKATKEIPYHGWTIRYRPSNGPQEKVKWQIMDKKGEVKHAGESMTDRDAINDAEDWINAGGGAEAEASKNITIDFNVDFAREFAPGGEQFWATFDKDGGAPVLMLSLEPQQGMKASHIRTQKSKITANTTKLPIVTLSPKEANAAGLKPNARYILGDKIPIDDNNAAFPLIYQGTVQHKGDTAFLKKPGLTVAHPRELNELSTDLLGRYKTASAADARSADKSGDVERANKRFNGVVKATLKQFDNDAKNHVTRTQNSVEEGSPNRYSGSPHSRYTANTNSPYDKYSNFKAWEAAANSINDSVHGGAAGVGTSDKFISYSTNGQTWARWDISDGSGLILKGQKPNVEEKIDPWNGYTSDDKKANALNKAPKTTMQGSTDVPFSQMVQDTIKTHGLKWAFDYYVKKHGLPPKHFQIYAGIR